MIEVLRGWVNRGCVGLTVRVLGIWVIQGGNRILCEWCAGKFVKW